MNIPQRTMSLRKYAVAAAFVVAALLLVLSVKGQPGKPLHFQYDLDPATGGPFESSNSRSRYALVESLVDNHTVYLSPKLKLFADPDINKRDNRYISVFLPGISFLAIPLYILGKAVGLPQFVTYLFNPLIALGNMFLISMLSRRFGAGKYAGLLSGFLFLFATNGLAYTQTLTQHQFTLSLVLLALYAILGKSTFKKNVLMGILIGVALIIDIPNVFILAPFVLYLFFQNLVIKTTLRRVVVKVKWTLVGLVIGTLPFLMVFMGYNYLTTHSLFTVAQSVGYGTYSAPGKTASPVIPASIYDTKLAIDSRALLQGLSVLLISNERSIFYYNAIVLIGILGLVLVIKGRKTDEYLAQTILGSLIVTVLLYAMFHDPWGGWSFGPRYLIPVTGLLTVFAGSALTRYKRNFLFIVLFAGIFLYSTSINVAGVLTTNNIPPKQEADRLLTPIPYTYAYNFRLIQDNTTSSLVYNAVFKKAMNVQTFFILYTSIIVLMGLTLYALMLRHDDTNL